MPKLLIESNCYVVFVELATGIVFKKDLTFYNTNNNGVDGNFEIFDDLEQAKRFVENFISSNPKFECVIYDSQGKMLDHVFSE